MLRGLALALLVVTTLLASCGDGDTNKTGILEGQVTIGPLEPVERPGVTPTVPPEAYAARKVMIYSQSGDRLIKQVDIGPDGHYRVELEIGTYSVDINRIGIDRSADVPRAIEIRAGQTLRLHIDIDTGIR